MVIPCNLIAPLTTPSPGLLRHLHNPARMPPRAPLNIDNFSIFVGYYNRPCKQMQFFYQQPCGFCKGRFYSPKRFGCGQRRRPGTIASGKGKSILTVRIAASGPIFRAFSLKAAGLQIAHLRIDGRHRRNNQCFAAKRRNLQR